MFGTIISLASLGIQAYEFVSNIRGGDNAKEVINQLERLNVTIEKLSDNLVPDTKR